MNLALEAARRPVCSCATFRRVSRLPTLPPPPEMTDSLRSQVARVQGTGYHALNSGVLSVLPMLPSQCPCSTPHSPK